MSDASPHPKNNWFASLKEVGEFIFALILTIYGVLGYRLLRDQWRVMRQQTQLMQQQTLVMQKQLMDAERSSAESDKVTQRQLGIAESQAASMGTLAEANKLIADATNISAGASKRVADSSAHQLEVTDRPWVRVTISITKPITFYPPDQTFTATWVVGMGAKVTLTNSGRSVASNTRVASRISFIGPRSEIWPADADKTATDVCKSDAIFMHPGTVLFPSDEVPEHSEMFESIPAEAIYPPRLGNWDRPVPMSQSDVQLLVIGCVTYTFSNSSVLHRTWYTYHIGKRIPPDSEALHTWSLRIGKDISPQDVFLEKRLYGGNGAD
jgi:hypothetical protein